jgi:hypothetical protein
MNRYANPLTLKQREQHKARFGAALKSFAAGLQSHVSTEDGQWSIKGFIDVYKNIYTISADTKIVSKILEIHLFPKILEFAEASGYKIVLAECQNWYPDLSFVKAADERIKFAVDLKTTYRDPEYPGHVNGFTLGSHGAYFKDRSSKKNIQFPYSQYLGHFSFGIIYTRVDGEAIDETRVLSVGELDDSVAGQKRIGVRQVTNVQSLRSIASVVRDFQFFVCEKWQLASDRQGSGNTANIGSISCMEDVVKGNGVFARLGEKWFDEYWMNHGQTTMLKDGRSVKITKLKDFVQFKGGDVALINRAASKRKQAK